VIATKTTDLVGSVSNSLSLRERVGVRVGVRGGAAKAHPGRRQRFGSAVGGYADSLPVLALPAVAELTALTAFATFRQSATVS